MVANAGSCLRMLVTGFVMVVVLLARAQFVRIGLGAFWCICADGDQTRNSGNGSGILYVVSCVMNIVAGGVTLE